MNELQTINGNGNGGALAVMPVMDIKSAMIRYQMVVSFVREIMVKGIDYGTVPGTDKDVLLKPGAERLCSFFGLAPEFHTVERTEDWTGEDHGAEPFIYYRVKCKLFQSGRFVGEGEGSCNTREGKYRWRWVKESDVPPGLDTTGLVKRSGSMTEFAFAVEKAETGGQYGKPAEYWKRFQDAIEDGSARRISRKSSKGKELDAWQIDATVYRLPNDDIASQANTVLKMAQKRALIAATLIAVNASEFFTQDMEDLVSQDADVIDAVYAPHVSHASTAPVSGNGAQKSLNETPAKDWPAAPEHWADEVAKAATKEGCGEIMRWVQAVEADPSRKTGTLRAAFLRMVDLAETDEDLGKISKALKAAPISDDYKVIVSSACMLRAAALAGGEPGPAPDSSGLELLLEAGRIDRETGEVLA